MAINYLLISPHTARSIKEHTPWTHSLLLEGSRTWCITKIALTALTFGIPLVLALGVDGTIALKNKITGHSSPQPQTHAPTPPNTQQPQQNAPLTAAGSSVENFAQTCINSVKGLVFGSIGFYQSHRTAIKMVGTGVAIYAIRRNGILASAKTLFNGAWWLGKTALEVLSNSASSTPPPVEKLSILGRAGNVAYNALSTVGLPVTLPVQGAWTFLSNVIPGAYFTVKDFGIPGFSLLYSSPQLVLSATFLDSIFSKGAIASILNGAYQKLSQANAKLGYKRKVWEKLPEARFGGLNRIRSTAMYQARSWFGGIGALQAVKSYCLIPIELYTLLGGLGLASITRAAQIYEGQSSFAATWQDITGKIGSWFALPTGFQTVQDLRMEAGRAYSAGHNIEAEALYRDSEIWEGNLILADKLEQQKNVLYKRKILSKISELRQELRGIRNEGERQTVEGYITGLRACLEDLNRLHQGPAHQQKLNEYKDAILTDKKVEKLQGRIDCLRRGENLKEYFRRKVEDKFQKDFERELHRARQRAQAAEEGRRRAYPNQQQNPFGGGFRHFPGFPPFPFQGANGNPHQGPIVEEVVDDDDDENAFQELEIPRTGSVGTGLNDDDALLSPEAAVPATC